jgi:hypothetical protein
MVASGEVNAIVTLLSEKQTATGPHIETTTSGRRRPDRIPTAASTFRDPRGPRGDGHDDDSDAGAIISIDSKSSTVRVLFVFNGG